MLEVRQNLTKIDPKILEQKHITLISLNFYPEDTAIGLYSSQLANYLRDKGAKVSIITAFPYYPQWKILEEYEKKPRYIQENYNGMTVYRYKQYTPKVPTFLKRVLHIIDFTIGSYFNIRKIRKCDYVISVIPFTSAAFLGNLLKRRLNSKHWIHIQDFEFDAAFQSGLLNSEGKNNSLMYRLLMRLERSVFSKSNVISTISHMMINKLKEKTISETYYLPNWIDENEIDPAKSSTHSYLRSSKFKILYSGNIGDKQDWDFFFKFLERLDLERFEVVIVGDGARRKYLEREIVKMNGVNYYPPVAYEELSDLLCSADAHILFQKSDVIDTVMPSKILGMMASKKPSVITGHPASEVAKVLTESEGGFYISDQNMDLLIQHFNEIYDDRVKAAQMGVKARQYVVTKFSKNMILDRFSEKLLEV